MSPNISPHHDPPGKIEDAVEGLMDVLSHGTTVEQREAVGVLDCLAKQRKENSKFITEIGATPVLVNLMSCQDMVTRGHVVSLLLEMSNDGGSEAISTIHEMLKRGPGLKASETAAKILVGLAKLEGLEESFGAAGGVAALVDMLRYRSTRKFQKEAIAALSSLLTLNKNNARAAKVGMAAVLVRLLAHGSPSIVDVDGILQLTALLATHKDGREELMKIDCASALSKVLNSGSIAQKESAASTLLSLNCDQNQFGSEVLSNALAIANANSYSSLSLNKCAELLSDRNGRHMGDEKQQSSPPGLTIPDEFRCPISLELMRDPVSVATDQTYERECIEKWLEGGHRSCPKTRQHLEHLQLRPNIRLAASIKTWCDRNGVSLQRSNSSSTRSCLNQPPGPQTCLNRSSPTEQPPEILGHSAVFVKDKERIQSLMQVLASEDPNVLSEEKRAATRELCQFAKSSRDHCHHIVEAGVLPPLSKLLSPSHDESTQEEAIATLLLLSINDENKRAMASSGVIKPIVELLKHGSMEARENAAATLFSLSIVDENKVSIGVTDAIPALVELLAMEKASPRAHKDAAIALMTLSIYQGNKATAVRAGVVPHLMTLLRDENMKMADLMLAMLAVLCTHFEGRAAIEKEESALRTFVELMRSGSNQNKENALTVLSALIFNNPTLIHEAEEFGADIIVTDLSKTGTQRIRMKAQALLDFVGKQELSD
ncbi:hypothetical protein Mapa_010811 [Marchantia paleacea]|nr:hypothetical protein Mapa_010811 [Marchantia paleacea]